MQHKNDFVLRELGGKALLVPTVSRRAKKGNGFVTLNETGRFIWDLLVKGQSIDELASAVAVKFDINFHRARLDVKIFLEEINNPTFGSSEGTTMHPSDSSLLLSELHQSAAELRQPANGTFELTSRCNLACNMCYVRHPACDGSQSEKELSATTWLSIAREAIKNGMVFLLLTGGEIFLRPDFFEIYEPLTRLGLVVSLYTNGTLITDKLARRLAQAPPNIVEITLYGATPSTYEAVTGVPGSYARCCAGIQALLDNGVPLGLKTTITRQNVGELEAMRRMADNWGVPLLADWVLTRRRDGLASDVEKCRLSASHCVTMETTGPGTAADDFAGESENISSNNDENFFCFGGKAGFVITSVGDMNVCLDLAMPAARPVETNFLAAWEKVQDYVDYAPPLAPFCLACEVRNYCLRCPAWSMLETDTLTAPIPYLCDIAYARNEFYSIKVESSSSTSRPS